MNSNRKSRTRQPRSQILWITFWFCVAASAPLQADQVLREGWLIQSSAVVDAPGEKISSAEFDASGWYRSSVPTTVLSALTRNGVYRDLYFGRNMDTVSPEPFHVSWWYRTEFRLDSDRAETVRLRFDGIN